MQAPIKLVNVLFGLGAKSLNAVGNLALKQLTGTKNTVPALPPASSQPVLPDKNQRLAEISSRLEAIQKEQNELLQEVASIMASDKINVEVWSRSSFVVVASAPPPIPKLPCETD